MIERKMLPRTGDCQLPGLRERLALIDSAISVLERYRDQSYEIAGDVREPVRRGGAEGVQPWSRECFGCEAVKGV